MPKQPIELSSSSVATLKKLHQVGAITKEAASVPMSTRAADILLKGGYLDKRVVRPKGGSQFTAYWLTDQGIAEIIKRARGS